MKYKGFIITPVPLLDYKPDERTGEYKAYKIGVPYYDILDPMENDKRYCACDSIRECKAEIDRLLKLIGMKDNTLKSWEQLK